jgi:hypothetical protein
MENSKPKKIKLTKSNVENLPYAEKGKQEDYFDTELDGFGVRVSHTGKKYFVRRLIGTRRVRVMIGSHPIKTAEKARGEAITKLGDMESGLDPNKQKREKARLTGPLPQFLNSCPKKLFPFVHAPSLNFAK